MYDCHKLEVEIWLVLLCYCVITIMIMVVILVAGFSSSMMAPGFTPPFLQHNQTNNQGMGEEMQQQVPEAVAAHKLPTTQVKTAPPLITTQVKTIPP